MQVSLVFILFALIGAQVLDGSTGTGLDPCLALQVELELSRSAGRDEPLEGELGD